MRHNRIAGQFRFGYTINWPFAQSGFRFLLERLEQLVSTARGRRALYGALVLAFFFAAAGLGIARSVVRHESIVFALGDGKSYYVYLPTLVIDGDLDITNQMREHWGTQFNPDDLEDRTERGYVRNKYPIGVALSLAPTFLLAHAVASAGYPPTGWSALAPHGYSAIYQFAMLATVMLMAWGTLALVDRLAEGHFGCDSRAIAFGVTCVAIGSPFAYFAIRAPLMPHIVSGFWVVAAIVICARIARDAMQKILRARDLFLLALTCSMALVCRPTNAFLGFFALWAFTAVFSNGLLGPFAKRVPLAMFGVLPLILQMLVWRQMFGHWIASAYPPYERFFWEEPLIVKTLFSPRAGLFSWSPVLVLAFAGFLVRLLKPMAAPNPRGTPALVCYLLSFVMLCYLNSAWWCWYFGDSIGGRPYIEIISMFMLGQTFFAEWFMSRSIRVNRVGFAATVLCVIFSFLISTAWDLRIIHHPVEPPGAAAVIFARGHL